jgi:transposase
MELPNQRVVALERAYKSAKGRKEAGRYQALWLLARGYTRRQASDIVGVGQTQLGRWVTNYNKHGLQGLKTKPQPGNHRKLTNKQRSVLRRLITQKTPAELGYGGRFWDVGGLKRLVKDRFQVKYKSTTSYRNLFKWCGFSYHKPDKVNKRQRAETIRDWEKKIKKDWRGIAETMGWSWWKTKPKSSLNPE